MHSTSHRIEFHRLALLRLLVGLFARAGLEPGTGRVDTLPRFVRNAIFLVLRQVESATRRLSYAKTEGMKIPEYVPRDKTGKSKPKGDQDCDIIGNGHRKKAGDGEKKTRAPRIPQFCLIDPRKFLEELFPHRKPRGSKPSRERRTERELLLRIHNYDGRPPFEVWAEPDPELSPDDELTAVAICRRMQAVFHALSDLDKQAQRMVREIAKRRAAKPGPGCVPPLRYGFPPGHRKKHIHEIDGILHECHMIAMRMMERASPVGV